MNRNIVYVTHATFLTWKVSTRIHPGCPENKCLREYTLVCCVHKNTPSLSTRIHPNNVHENSPKMSTRIHLKSVHENSPIQRNSSGQKCPREGRESVHENSPLLSTRIPLLCPREFFHPKFWPKVDKIKHWWTSDQ
jgi:hypothetical protein